MTTLLPRRLALLLVVAALSLAACDAGDPAGDPYTPPADEVVAGVNLSALFAAPTGAELDTVRAMWTARDWTLANRYTFELVAEHEGADGAELQVYRALDRTSGAVLFHGVVRLPLRQPGDVRQRPLLLVLPDGDDGASARILSNGTLPIFSGKRDDLVYALLAYRGEPLEVAGVTYDSPAAPSPYDFDADDALALLGYVRSLGRGALVDPERVGVFGLGRGGGTALLTEARTNAYDVVFDLAGPTDLFLNTFRGRVRGLLRGQSGGAFPAIEALAEQIVYPLRDSAMTVAQARIALLLRSPRYFVGPPPFITVVHGQLDDVVPVEHSGALNLESPTPDSETPAVFLRLPDDDHDSILTEGEVIDLVTTQLRERLAF